MPIVGWLQILVVIALSELWRYEHLAGAFMGVDLIFMVLYEEGI